MTVGDLLCALGWALVWLVVIGLAWAGRRTAPAEVYVRWPASDDR